MALCGDYAFGKGERRAAARSEARARKAESKAAQRSRSTALVGAGAPVDDEVDNDVVDDTAAGDTSAVHVTDAGVKDSDDDYVPSKWGPRLGLIGVVLTTLALVAHITSLVLRGLATERLPWGNMFEFASAIVICAVVTYLVLAFRRPDRRFLGAFLLPIVVLILVLSGLKLYVTAGPVVASLRSYWLAIHVSAASIASGILLVSFVASVLYLVKVRHEEKERATGDYVPSRIAGALPSSATLDRLAARTMMFAFPIWTFAIIAGAIWAEAAWGRYWGWDPKETWAFISWVVYAGYLHARATPGWKGRKSAYLNILGAATMIFNFVVVNTVIAGLHSYSGL
ncbi:c-type cytochrome biogenesis protein CcsB [Epidermidibacterium keratini]|uniref:C-type cytochrome biogenesis protein CcsB n=2 Tax=Epidermidibacterium keratini TaxID=1891644 RepID=A0A7L4YSU6_9ACTN|nr:c-type cytochrome biogenesis protein CcsB [Epidermidibacterium keratini]